MKNTLRCSFVFSIIVFSISKLFAQNADSAQLYLKKGRDEVAQRHFMIAANYLDKAIVFDPASMDAYLENGKANLEMRKIDVALSNFSKAHQLQPANAVAIKELSTLYFNNRQFEKAIAMVQQCKECELADRITGMSYYHLEDYGKAVIALQKAIKKNSADAEATYTLARTYLELEDEKNAIPNYQKAVALDTTKFVWMYELALMYYNMDNYREALTYFVKAGNAGYTKSSDFYENIGFAYLYNGNVDNGLKNLAVVLARKPGNLTLLGDIAQAMYKTERYDDALTYYQKIIDLSPKDARTLYMAGITFQKKGEKEKGQAMCDRAIAMDPSLAEKRQKKGEQFGL